MICMGFLWPVSGWAVEVVPLFDSQNDDERVIGPVRQLTLTTKASVVTHQFDENGRLVETATRSRTDPAQEGVEKVLYRYNSGGERMGEFAVDSEGEAIPVRLSAFDSNGRRTAEARYHLCRTFSSLDLYTYDEAGRLAVELRFESRRLSKREFQYGEDGTLQRVRTHRNGRLLGTTHYHYDEAGHVANTVFKLPDETLSATALFRYDQQGNLMTVVQTHPHNPALDKTEITSFEYDATGNWIRRTIIRAVNPLDEDGQPFEDDVEITERTIVYADGSAQELGR